VKGLTRSDSASMPVSPPGIDSPPGALRSSIPRTRLKKYRKPSLPDWLPHPWRRPLRAEDPAGPRPSERGSASKPLRYLVRFRQLTPADRSGRVAWAVRSVGVVGYQRRGEAASEGITSCLKSDFAVVAR
jgi:hypothetical protein